MNIEIINASPKPEELVCLAARNDYRADGIIGHSFRDTMVEIDEDEGHIDRLEDEGWTWKENGHPRELEAKKRTLIDHLIKQGHFGPFEHPQAVVAIEGVTRVVTHQIVRHRHFSFDQQSLRYVDLGPEFDQQPFDRAEIAERFQFPEFRGEDFDVDREGVHEFAERGNIDDTYAAAYSAAIEHYKSLRAMDVPKEQARKVLPMGVKTNIVMSGNARAWMHILNVRTQADVQGETRRCAEAIFEALKGWMPYTFEKYDEDVLPLSLNP